MRRVLMALVAAVAALALSAVTAQARGIPAVGVNIVVATTLPDSGPSYGPFTASGPGVDLGIVCATGQTVDLAERVTGSGNAGINFHVVKRFTCDDGSGTFDVKLSVRLDKNGTNFNWTVVGGTGAYAALHGSGQGFGIQAPGGVTDYYAGLVH